jgi:hypothetical protein
VPPTYSYFRPLSNKRIIQYLLEEMARCFDTEKDAFKREELLKLVQVLD